ncbi:MAG: hypothetical protein ACTHL3_06250 [Candidatus Nitrosocosmicus sp.]
MESVIVETDREEEVLERIQLGFEYQFKQYGKCKKEDISSLDYDTLQECKIIQRIVIVDEAVIK